MLALVAASCDFNVTGLSAGGDDAAVDQGNDDLSLPNDGPGDGPFTVDGPPTDGPPMDAPPPPPDLRMADLTSCPPCATSCAPCCNDVCANTASCSSSCSGGGCSNCNQSCDNANTCTFSCAGGATCVAVANNSGSATTSCSGGSTCNVTCTDVSNNCAVACTGGSHCICKGQNCQFSSCQGGALGQMSCPNNVIICNIALCPL